MMVGEVGMHQGAILLRPHPHVDNPLLEPGSLQRTRGHFGKRTGGVGAAKRAEAMFRSRADVGITGVERSAYSGEHEKRNVVRLIKNVNVGVCRKVSAHPGKTVGRVESRISARHGPVLYRQILAWRRHEIG